MCTNQSCCIEGCAIAYGKCHCGCGEDTSVPKETNRSVNQFKGRPILFRHGHNGSRRTTREDAIAAGWFNPNDTGKCLCGCGKPVKRAPRTDRLKGVFRGEYRHYLPGHRLRELTQCALRHVGSDGYWLYRSPNHPHVQANGYVREHRRIVEAHLGRHLAPGEVVHHVNGDKQDNRIENLEVMTDREHKLLHLRQTPLPGKET